MEDQILIKSYQTNSSSHWGFGPSVALGFSLAKDSHWFVESKCNVSVYNSYRKHIELTRSATLAFVLGYMF